jgi:hypothetical protein
VNNPLPLAPIQKSTQIVSKAQPTPSLARTEDCLNGTSFEQRKIQNVESPKTTNTSSPNMSNGNDSNRQPLVLVYFCEQLVRLARWSAKVAFYVTIGFVMAAIFNQSRLVEGLWRTMNDGNNDGSVQVKDTMKELASTTNCSASSLSSDGSYFSSSSVLPLLQPSLEVSLNQSNENRPIDPRKVIFFHIHEAKTAGSSLNRYLARRYHTVCGHKGYSFDQPLHVGAEPRYIAGTSWGPDRVRPYKMKDRGFHNCRVLSHETKASKTLELIRQLQQTFGFYVHVLIPCRDAISHRISKCAHKRGMHKKMASLNWTFQSNDEDICGILISQCDVWEDRYTLSYETVANQVTYFWYKNFTQLDRILEPYVPQRGYPLPDATTLYQTNTQFSSDWMEEVTRRCATQVNQYFIENVDMYQQCAKYVPEVHLQKQF